MCVHSVMHEWNTFHGSDVMESASKLFRLGAFISIILMKSKSHSLFWIIAINKSTEATQHTPTKWKLKSQRQSSTRENGQQIMWVMFQSHTE